MKLACGIIYVLLFCAAGSVSQAGEITARSVFAMLPISIFESTPEGMSEMDKQELLATGQTEFWEIAAETPDILVFANVPMRDRAIGMRLFRNERDGSAEAAIGTLEEPVCGLELWRLDSAGRLVPQDPPDEPEISEFFAPRHKLAKRIRSAVQICLGDGGLKALPIFWNEYGMLPARVNNDINYIWNGQDFEKQVSPAKPKKDDIIN